MKNIPTIILLTGILVAGCAFNVAAQRKAHNTASAKAYYGYASAPTKFKAKKKKKIHHYTISQPPQPAKGTRSNTITRRKHAHS